MASFDVYQITITVLFSVCAYFIKSLLNKNEKLADSVVVLTSDVMLLKERLSALDGLSDKLQFLRDDMKSAEREITILSRDQNTIWKNIDDLKEMGCKE